MGEEGGVTCDMRLTKNKAIPLEMGLHKELLLFDLWDFCI